MELTHSDIADIIRLIDSSTLDELVLEVGGVRIEARRRGATSSASTPISIAPEQAAVPVEASPPRPAAEAPAAAPPSAASAPVVAPGQVTVTAPMVGTFYRRPSPDSPPFVEVGARIEIGDPLCMVEVMKLYTTLCAEMAGTVAAVCADDASLVEYGHVLFIIDPD